MIPVTISDNHNYNSNNRRINPVIMEGHFKFEILKRVKVWLGMKSKDYYQHKLPAARKIVVAQLPNGSLLHSITVCRVI